MSGRSEFRQGDWGVGIHERFDLVLINPPYISTQANLPHAVVGHEPHGALFSGSDGLNDYRRIPPALSALPNAEGMEATVIVFDQGPSEVRIFSEQGLSVCCRTDRGGPDRSRCILSSGVPQR